MSDKVIVRVIVQRQVLEQREYAPGSLSKFQNRDDHFREPAMRNAAEVAEMVKRRDAA